MSPSACALTSTSRTAGGSAGAPVERARPQASVPSGERGESRQPRPCRERISSSVSVPLGQHPEAEFTLHGAQAPLIARSAWTFDPLRRSRALPAGAWPFSRLDAIKSYVADLAEFSDCLNFAPGRGHGCIPSLLDCLGLDLARPMPQAASGRDVVNVGSPPLQPSIPDPPQALIYRKGRPQGNFVPTQR